MSRIKEEMEFAKRIIYLEVCIKIFKVEHI